tara:strand:+ start:761 stop:1183 length:423 start_codon:yes stop_codon:yes gene_type:complete
MNKEDTEKAMDKIMLDKQLNKDLKIQSDEIIRLIEELKRVNRKASVMESDNFRLIELQNQWENRHLDENGFHPIPLPIVRRELSEENEGNKRISMYRIFGQFHVLPFIKITYDRTLNGEYEFIFGWINIGITFAFKPKQR